MDLLYADSAFSKSNMNTLCNCIRDWLSSLKMRFVYVSYLLNHVIKIAYLRSQKRPLNRTAYILTKLHPISRLDMMSLPVLQLRRVIIKTCIFLQYYMHVLCYLAWNMHPTRSDIMFILEGGQSLQHGQKTSFWQQCACSFPANFVFILIPPVLVCDTHMINHASFLWL